MPGVGLVFAPVTFGNRSPLCDAAWPLRFIEAQSPIDGLRQGGVDIDGSRAGGKERITVAARDFLRTINARFGNPPRHAVIKRGAKRVYVGPGTVRSGGRILLGRRVSLRDEQMRRYGGSSLNLACRTASNRIDRVFLSCSIMR